MKRLILALSSGILLAACGHTPPGEGLAADLDGAPDWVRKAGCAGFSGEAPQKICAIGSVGGTNNISLARTGAEGRGRTAIARSLQSKVSAMLKDYQSTTGDFGGVGDEQQITDVSKQLTSMALNGTRTLDTWVSSKGTFYALVMLDTDSFNKALAGMTQLSQKVREAITQRANTAFKEMDSELQKGGAE